MADQDVRPARAGDIPAIVEMGKAFHAKGGLSFGYDEGAVSALVERLIESDSGTVLMSDGGMIGGLLSPAYCDPKWNMAVELFWWASDRRGLKLLSAFEAWAADMGAQEVRMTTLNALPSGDRIVTRRGYAPVETSYQKVI